MSCLFGPQNTLHNVFIDTTQISRINLSLEKTFVCCQCSYITRKSGLPLDTTRQTASHRQIKIQASQIPVSL